MKYELTYAVSEKVKNKIHVTEDTVSGDDLDELLEKIFKQYTDTYVVVKQKNFELVSPKICITGHIKEKRNRSEQ